MAGDRVKIPSALDLAQIQESFRDIEKLIREFNTNVEMHGNRIIGAGRAIDPNDYVTLKQMQDSLPPDPAAPPPAFVPPSFRCRHNAGQSIAHNGTVTVAFNTDVWNIGDMHSTTTNNSRATVRIPDKYALGTTIEVSNSGTSMSVFIGIIRNNTTYVVASEVYHPGTTAFMNVHTIVSAVAGDYFEVIVFQSNSGAATETISATQERGAQFWGHYLSA